METKKLVRVAEVAQLLNVSPKTVARWSKDGKVPVAFTTIGGHRLYDLAVIEALAARLAGES